VDVNLDSADKAIVDLDPTGSGECFSLARVKRVLVGALLNTGGATPEGVTPGGFEEFEIIAATDADGTGATVVKASTIFDGATPAGINDTLWLEATAEQIHEVLATATHYGVRIEVVTTTDLCSVVVIEERLEAHDGLTADYMVNA
jgi:hypothetical protein